MNTDNVWIVIVLLVVILVGSNIVMFAIVRGARGGNTNWFKTTSDKFTQPWSKEDKDWNELSKRVRNLQNDNKTDDDPR